MSNLSSGPAGDNAHDDDNQLDHPMNDPMNDPIPKIPTIHEHVGQLLGAYALNAISDSESDSEIELVELHLEHCADCHGELAEHLATAARLGAASVVPVAPRVWDTVLNEIRSTSNIQTPSIQSSAVSETQLEANSVSSTPDAVTRIIQTANAQALAMHPRETAAPPNLSAHDSLQHDSLQHDSLQHDAVENDASNVIDFATASSKHRKRRTWRVAVAAAVATAAITVPIVSSIGGSSPSLAALAKRVAEQPSSQAMTLRSESGADVATVVVGQGGQGYLTSDSLPKLPTGKAYQLWAVTSIGPVSIGMLGGDPNVQAFTAPAKFAAMAISVEDAQGAITPTPPIASASV